MTLDQNMCKMFADLEHCIGCECYNPNSYDGWNDVEGCAFRYPINIPITDKNGKTTFEKVKGRINRTAEFWSWNIDPTALSFMKYKFGSNELLIGRGLKNVLDYLEARYNLDFNKLEEELQNRR